MSFQCACCRDLVGGDAEPGKECLRCAVEEGCHAQLREENARLREALDFYADETIWECDEATGGPVPQLICPADRDSGDIAREALRGTPKEPAPEPEIDFGLLAKFASGEGGRRTGALMRAGYLCVEVTEAGHWALIDRNRRRVGGPADGGAK